MVLCIYFSLVFDIFINYYTYSRYSVLSILIPLPQICIQITTLHPICYLNSNWENEIEFKRHSTVNSEWHRTPSEYILPYHSMKCLLLKRLELCCRRNLSYFINSHFSVQTTDCLRSYKWSSVVLLMPESFHPYQMQTNCYKQEHSES